MTCSRPAAAVGECSVEASVSDDPEGVYEWTK
jgi:hypothetical protein